jgi:hypothetical protein
MACALTGRQPFGVAPDPSLLRRSRPVGNVRWLIGHCEVWRRHPTTPFRAATAQRSNTRDGSAWWRPTAREGLTCTAVVSMLVVGQVGRPVADEHLLHVPSEIISAKISLHTKLMSFRHHRRFGGLVLRFSGSSIHEGGLTGFTNLPSFILS